MIALTLKEVAGACGGRLAGADPDRLVRGISIDSRTLREGDLFVALRGEHADGHRFVADALARGAAAVLVREQPERARDAVVVADPLAALAGLALAVRDRLRARVIAVTGSSGKTCTKDFTAAAAGTVRRVVASRASHNNEIGVPLTVCAAGEETEVLVAEVGSRGRGHIAALAPVLRPDVAVITNVGSAHAGMFGSIEATAEAKAELVDALGPEGVAVLNGDDERVASMASRAPRAILFGAGRDVRAEDVRFDDAARARFTLVTPWGSAPVALRLPGAHMVANALAAAAAAHEAGAGVEDAARGLSEATGPAGRMQVREIGSRRVIDDAYNANPESTAAALKALVSMAGGRPTWAVLGHMAELGQESMDAHDRIGRLVVRLGVAHLVTVGEEARAMHEAARLEGFFDPGEALFAAGVEEAIELLRTRAEADAIVLVKASRAAGLDRLVRALEEQA
ncbi:MAG TPA: UDP-N-acetylmuramoyl-tripeptide--D-alanyl-D-alanine ligase [Actinomycetota bacterium]